MVGVVKNQNKEYHGDKRGPGFKAFKSSMSCDRRVKESLGRVLDIKAIKGSRLE